ncbi:MAG: Xaa-Pro peptidase family protein [Candidatus Anstonellaceae archaeon]
MRKELEERRRSLFEGAEFGCALFPNTHNYSQSFSYFAGCQIDSSYLVLKPSGGVLFVHQMNYNQAKESSYYPVRKIAKDAIEEIKTACGRAKVGVCMREISAAQFAAGKKAGLKLVEADRKVLSLRAQKSRQEAEFMANSARIARKILEGFDPWEYRTEKEAAKALKMLALQEGAEVCFEPIVASGKNARFPHYHPAEAKISDVVLVDFGVKHMRYCSDFTRCYFKSKNTPAFRDYEKCQQVFWGIFEKLGQCSEGKEVAAIAKKEMERAGLPKLVHAIGHGVGLEVHEAPYLGANSKDKLGVGTVIALEPAAYKGTYGVRFEEMVILTQKGWKLL